MSADVSYRPLFCGGLHNIFLVLGLACFLYSLLMAMHFYSFELVGTIAAEKRVCEEPLKNRCDTITYFKMSDGTVSEFLLPIGFFDFDLFGAGKKIEKYKFSYQYRVDGRVYHFRYYVHFLVIAVSGVIMLRLWASKVFRQFINRFLRKKW